MNDAEVIIRDAFRDPERALKELERIECEESLLGFIKHAWKQLHPATPFISGWAVETMCRHLEALADGTIDRLLINIPPGCTKSMVVNVFFPLWLWGPKGRQHEQFISAGYNLDLPTRDLGHAREVQRSEWFQSHWPVQNRKDHDGKENYRNEGTGWRKATGVGGGLTGWRGSFFIIDDPLSTLTAESDTERATCRTWFGETVPTRFNDQLKPKYAIIMQRLHVGDLSGMILDDLAESQNWTTLILPMEAELKFKTWSTVPSPFGPPKKMRRVKEEAETIPYYVEDPDGTLMWPQDPRTKEGELLWPERFSREAVEDLKASFRSAGGAYAEACQLQQRPIPRAGGMFDVKELNYVDTPPSDARFVRGWDLAATKDGSGAWSVGLLMAVSKGHYYICDVLRGRWAADEVQDNITSAAERDGYDAQQDLPQDPGQSGKSQKLALAKALSGYDFVFSTESGSKEDRARPFAAQVNSGNVSLVRAPWNSSLVAEMALFPGSKWKDQCDAASRAFMNLALDEGAQPVTAPRLIS